MKRDKTIDTLRGLAMLAMIVLHACSYYLRDKLTLSIWDNLQWAVPVFLFCSFWLFFEKTKEFSAESWIPYLKKRITRLLIPYYVFLAAYFPLLAIFEHKKYNWGAIIPANMLLYKGLDFNWLVLAFVYFTVLMPLIILAKKKKIVFYGYFALALVSSVFFIFYTPNYREIMWLPWSVYIYFTFYIQKYRNNRNVLFLTAFLAGVAFLAVKYYEAAIGHTLTQYANKYPPTIYHLTFGIFWVIVLRWLAEKNVFSILHFDRLLHFLSVNSYSIFFIHILVMFMIAWLRLLPPNWPLFFAMIISITSLVQIGINKISNYAFKK